MVYGATACKEDKQGANTMAVLHIVTQTIDVLHTVTQTIDMQHTVT